ncbi:MAG: hypothetical protein NT013_17605 [Planctomycetia bacterium]|nr:hypothetical protein [Planctomycetia bacterium]
MKAATMTQKQLSNQLVEDRPTHKRQTQAGIVRLTRPPGMVKVLQAHLSQPITDCVISLSVFVNESKTWF